MCLSVHTPLRGISDGVISLLNALIRSECGGGVWINDNHNANAAQHVLTESPVDNGQTEKWFLYGTLCGIGMLLIVCCIAWNAVKMVREIKTMDPVALSQHSDGHHPHHHHHQPVATTSGTMPIPPPCHASNCSISESTNISMFADISEARTSVDIVYGNEESQETEALR